MGLDVRQIRRKPAETCRCDASVHLRTWKSCPHFLKKRLIRWTSCPTGQVFFDQKRRFLGGGFKYVFIFTLSWGSDLI